MRKVAAAPGQVSEVLKTLNHLLGGTDLTLLIKAILAAQQKFSHADASHLSEYLTERATGLDAVAAEVAGPSGRAPTHDEREAANKKLKYETNEFMLTLLLEPSMDSAFAAAVVVALQRQIQSTAVSWTKQQRDVREGKIHVLKDPKLLTLSVENLPLPALTNKTPAVQQLLEESRKMMAHPYDGVWWKTAVSNFIKEHPEQMRAEIESRNAGYLLYRKAGDAGGHQH